MQITSSEKLNLLGNALPSGDLPLYAPGSKFMICFSSWCRPAVDPVLDHAEDVTNVRMILSYVAQPFEGGLVSNASFAGVEEAKEVQVQEAPVIIGIEMMSSDDSIDSCVIAGI